MRSSPLESALARYNIPRLWEQLALPGLPAKSCKSPFRDDCKPSFSVYNDGKSWKDHGTGESGGIIEFIAKAKGINASEACQWLIAKNRGNYHKLSSRPSPTPRKRRKNQSATLGSVSIPPFTTGTYDWSERLKQSRNLPNILGIKELLNRGILRFGGMNDGRDPARAWLVVDSSHKNAQARRLDRLPWQSLPGCPKAKTLKGSIASWPIGVPELRKRNSAMLCEGGPDLLVAATIAAMDPSVDIQEIAFVCMTGASNQIHPAAAELFEGKRIRIFQHADAPGRAAGVRWHRQLLQAGAAHVDRWESDHEDEDLNDYLSRTFEMESPHTLLEELTPR